MDYTKYTSDILLPSFVTETQYGTPVAAMIFRNAENPGTDRIRRGIQVLNSTQATSYYGAYNFPTVEENLVQNLNFEFKDYGTQVTVNRSEIVRGQAVNSKVLDIAAAKASLTNAGLTMRIMTDMYGDGTGNGGKNMNGFENLIDDATTAPIIGGLSRLLYPALNSYVDSVTTLTLNDMVVAFQNAKWDSNTPDMTVVNQNTLWTNIEAFLSDKQQNMVVTKPMSESFTMKENGLAGLFGYETLFFKGTPVIGDRYCGDDRVYFINSNFMYLKYLDTNVTEFDDVKPNFDNFEVKGGVPKEDYKTLGASASKFQTVPGGTAFTATIHTTLQLDADSRYHSKLIAG